APAGCGRLILQRVPRLRQDCLTSVVSGAVMTDRSDASSLSGWDLAHAACQAMRSLKGTGLGEFRLNSAGYPSQPLADDQECLLSWCPSTGWKSHLPQEDDRRTLLDL